jgi:hypothetical protein
MTTFFKKTLKNGVFSAFLFVTLSLFAQEIPYVTDWKKAPTATELDLKIWENDTLAEAVVLDHTGLLTMQEVQYKYGFAFTEHKRIKILKKSAFNRANLRLLFYAGGKVENIDYIKAWTWLTNGQKVAVDPKSIVYEKINGNLAVAKVTFPQVTEGVILEYEWSLESIRIQRLRDWDFQADIPVRHSVFTIDLYTRYDYTFLLQGDIKTTERDSRDSRTKMTFFTNDLPALREEKFISTMDDYRTSIKFQLAKVHDWQAGTQEILTSWQGTAKALSESEVFGKYYTRKFDDAWKALEPNLTPADTGTVRIQKIYDFVNNRITSEGRSWSASQTVNEVFKKGKGTSGEINLMLVALLREAGLSAHAVIISTRDNGRMYEGYPMLEQFNHCIVRVEFTDGRILLLDGGNKLRPMGILRESALNNRGCLIREKRAEWIDIRPPFSSLAASLNFTFDEEGTLKGSVQNMLRGYIGVDAREKLEEDKSGKYIERGWLADNPDFKMDSFKVVNADNPNEPLRISYNCVLPNAIQTTNDLIYIKPTFNSGLEVSPFKSPERYFPVDMPYPYQDQFVLNLAIPKGYKLEEAPKSVTMALPNNGGSFIYQMNDKVEGQLQINFRIKIQKTYFTGDEYPALKKFFDDIAAKLQEMVVLKKMAG